MNMTDDKLGALVRAHEVAKRSVADLERKAESMSKLLTAVSGVLREHGRLIGDANDFTCTSTSVHDTRQKWPSFDDLQKLLDDLQHQRDEVKRLGAERDAVRY